MPGKHCIYYILTIEGGTMLSIERVCRLACTLRVHAQAKAHCIDKSPCMTWLTWARGCHLPTLSLCEPQCRSHLSPVFHGILESWNNLSDINDIKVKVLSLKQIFTLARKMPVISTEGSCEDQRNTLYVRMICSFGGNHTHFPLRSDNMWYKKLGCS